MHDFKRIDAKTITLFCEAGMSDQEIADNLNCSRDVVYAFRKTFVPAKRDRTKPVSTISKIRPRDAREFMDYKKESAMEFGSRMLLTRQLETGQHALTKERFIGVVKELGLTDRLPRGLQ